MQKPELVALTQQYTGWDRYSAKAGKDTSVLSLAQALGGAAWAQEGHRDLCCT